MVLLTIFFLVFIFYKETFFYYFVSDDFILLSYKKNLADLFRIDPLNNHYTPVNSMANFFLYQLFGLNPIPYHIFIVLVHIVNIYLVYQLSKVFIKNKVKNVLTALVFAFFFANYEVVYWIGGNNNSLMVTFYLMALLSLINYVKVGKNIFAFLFQVAFVFAFLTHEYAVSLIFVGVVYWWIFSKIKNKKEFFKLFLFPTVVFLTTTILKIIFVKMPLLVRTPSILKFIAFSLRSFVYLFIPNPYLVDKLPNALIPLIFLVILVFLLKFTKNKQTLFLLIWAAATIFVYSITSAPQARYFYLSFIPIIIYILSVVKIELPRMSFPRRRESRLKLIDWVPSFEGMTNSSTAIIYLVFIFISGVVFLQNQKYYWHLSSEITKNVIADIKKSYPRPQKDDVLYFVNLPDSSNEGIWKAYVFRAGFKELLNSVVGVHPKKIVYLTTDKRLPQIKKNTIVFVYKEELKSVVLLK